MRLVNTAIIVGDVLKVLQSFEDNTFDAGLCDPPYALEFLGKDWDKALPSKKVWREVLRVCKPGAVFLGFGGPRTYHRLGCHMEDAGWEIRDCLIWLNAQGFPKGQNISKAIDKKLADAGFSNPDEHDVLPPAYSEVQRWFGYRTALKPAYEPIVVAMAPLDGTFADNALSHGVAGLNIDAARIPLDTADVGSEEHRGRFPANVILDEEAAAMLDKCSPHSKGGKYRRSGHRARKHKGQQLYGGGLGGGGQQAPDTYGDAGGPSRFFYCAKAGKRERNEGLPSGQKNGHPCVKPVALTEYLARLILPPKRDEPRRLLVPYSGSGSEMIGAMLAGWDSVLGIEREKEYVDIARRRLAYWKKKRK